MHPFREHSAAKKKIIFVFCVRCRLAPAPVLCAPLPCVLGSSSLLLLRFLLFSSPLRSLLPLALIPAAPAPVLRLRFSARSRLRQRTTPSHWRRLCRRHALRPWRRAAAALRRRVVRMCCGVVALSMRTRCGCCRAIEGGSAARMVRRKKIRGNQKQSSAH